MPPKMNNLEGAKQALQGKNHNNKINVLKALLLQLAPHDIEKLFLEIQEELYRHYNSSSSHMGATYSKPDPFTTYTAATAQEAMMQEKKTMCDTKKVDWKNEYFGLWK